MSWRDILKIHPAAEIFPLMSHQDRDALGADIRANGLKARIALLFDEGGKPQVLDGRNRLDAMALAGFKFSPGNPDDHNMVVLVTHPDGRDVTEDCWHAHFDDCRHIKGDPYAYVLSANILRRHLTAAQRGELIEKLLKATPEKSDRAIADQVKADHKTVAANRERLESSGEIPHIEPTGRVDAGGRNRARKTPPKPKKPTSEPGPVSAKPKAEAGAAELDLDPDRRRFQIRLEMGLFHPPVLRGEMSQLFGDAEPRNAARLIEAIVGGLSANTKRLADIPKAMRVAMARGFLDALSITMTDLVPIGESSDATLH